MRRLPHAVRLLLSTAAAACALLLTQPVVAQDWNPEVFVELLGAAEADYVAGDYGAAAQKYGELRSMLSGALASGAIEAEHQPAARESLAVIAYQLGRSQQETKQCVAAGETFAELARTGDLSEGVRVKLPARLGEAQLCAAGVHLEAGELEAAATRLEAAERALGGASSEAIASVLSAEQASELEGALAGSRTELGELETRYVTARSEATRAALAQGDCAAATSHLAALEARDADAAQVSELREEVAECEPPEVDDDDGEDGEGMSYAEMEPWLAVGVMGVGGALIATAVILEAVNADDVDAHDEAHDACLAGTTAQCQTALELSDDISSQQVTTGVLLGVGVAALGGGLAWFLIATMDDGSEVEVAPSASLSGGRLDLKVRF